MLSNTSIPRYYGAFREAVMSGQIPICETIELQMHRIDDKIANAIMKTTECFELDICQVGQCPTRLIHAVSTGWNAP